MGTRRKFSRLDYIELFNDLDNTGRILLLGNIANVLLKMMQVNGLNDKDTSNLDGESTIMSFRQDFINELKANYKK